MMPAPSDPVFADIPKEAFDHVHPRSACWRKVKMKSRVTLLPGLHFLMLMRGLIVANNVHFFIRWDTSFDQVQKLDPFLMAVLLFALPNDMPSAMFRRYKKRRRPVAILPASFRAS